MVYIVGQPGSTTEDAARRAMLEACRVTRGRNKPFYAVTDFATAGGTRERETRSEGHDYILNSTGQAVAGIYRPAESETSSYGNAVLKVTMITPDSIELFGNSLQIVNANSCLIHSRPN